MVHELGYAKVSRLSWKQLLAILDTVPSSYYTSVVVLQWIAAVLRARDQLCYFVFFLHWSQLFFAHNVSGIISYDRKQLLDISTAITNLNLDQHFYFNKSEALEIMLVLDQALIPGTRKRKQRQKRGQRGNILTILRRRANRSPLPSVLLADVQSLEIKLDELH